MITRIELQNFMAHRRTVIEPAAGLTVLVGPNNVGKSAVVAALQILCQNDKSTFVMRHGEKECAVIVETSDGHRIEWRRKNAPRYIIDGKTFDRLGNSTIPDELQPLLRLPLVADESDDSFDVHFGSQKSPIFLLNSTPSVAAKFFASSSDAIRLLEMQQRHKDKLSKAKAEEKQLEAEAGKLNTELAILNAVVPAAERLTELEAAYEALTELAAVIAELERHEKLLQAKSAEVELFDTQVEALRNLQPAPALEDDAPLEQLANSLSAMARQTQRFRQLSAASRPLSAPPVLADVRSLEQLVDELDRTTVRSRRLTDEASTVESLNAPPELADERTLETLMTRCDSAGTALKLASDQSRALANLEAAPLLHDPSALTSLVELLQSSGTNVSRLADSVALFNRMAVPPVLDDYVAIDGLAGQLQAGHRRIADGTAEVETLTRDITVVVQELQQAAEGQACPTCGQVISPEQLLAMAVAPGGHAHG